MNALLVAQKASVALRGGNGEDPATGRNDGALAARRDADAGDVTLDIFECGPHFREVALDVDVDSTGFPRRQVEKVDRTQFFVDDRGFQGAIKPSDYFGMLKLFGEDSETEIAVDWPDVEVLQLSLTNNNLNPVIHVAWRYRWLDRFVDEEFSDHVI